MARQQYRTEMGVLKKILDIIMENGRNGAIISAICLKANLSHYAALEKCEKFMDAGLVESVKNDRNRIFLITEKGIKFAQEFQKFTQLTEDTKIRL